MLFLLILGNIWCLVVTSVALRSYYSNFEINQWKKYSFTLEPIQLHIETNPTSHWNKSNFKLEQIKFINGKKIILYWNKSIFTMDQIQFHIETNTILHWKKSNYKLEQLPI